MPKNDGVLLVVARKDRKARIELGAHYGGGRDGDAAKIMSGIANSRARPRTDVVVLSNSLASRDVIRL